MIHWLKAAWISFQVAQNAHRLIFLQRLANEYGADHHDIPENYRANLLSYRNVVQWFLMEHPDLMRNIWPLEEAQNLYWRTQNLIGIGETILYGDA